MEENRLNSTDTLSNIKLNSTDVIDSKESNTTNEEGRNITTNETLERQKRQTSDEEGGEGENKATNEAVEVVDGSKSLRNRVVPMLTGFVGVQPKKGLLSQSTPCKCDDPVLRLRKDFKTGESWNDDLLDPSTSAFVTLKNDIEQKVPVNSL